MTEADPHIAKARRFLDMARLSLTGDFDEMAGRDAYLAAYHAALAYIAVHDPDAPKTHRGVHNRFSMVAKDDPRVDAEFVTFLARAIVIKNAADYSTDPNVTKPQAEAAIATAAKFVDAISSILTPPP